jgi:AcrR family transcriptional regulator
MPGTGGRTGRRPGTNPTRQQILEAAREAFAASGFRGATIRAIAQSAEVDPGLVHHYFPTKADLLGACVQLPDGAVPTVLAILGGDSADIGDRLTRAYLTLWEDQQTRRQMEIITKLSLTDPLAMAHVRPALMEVLASVVDHLEAPDPQMRFQLAMSQLLGVAVLRHLTRLPPLSTLAFDDLVARVARTVQLHLSGR